MKYLKIYEDFNGLETKVRNFCKKHKIDFSTITIENGVVNVDGDINLFAEKLKTLPFKFGTVTGNFHTGGNLFEKLKNFPDVIGGHFIISDNKLKSLVGGPYSVGGEFDCSYNVLTSLVGGPKYVVENYICKNNDLMTLEGSPEVVNRSFVCKENQLESLEFSPREVKGYFDCSDNSIKSLIGGPNTENAYNCQYNMLSNLEGVPRVLNTLYCSSNYLTTLKGGPEVVYQTFDCSWNRNLKTLDGIPKKIVTLKCDNNIELYKIDGLYEAENFNFTQCAFDIIWGLISDSVQKNPSLFSLFQEYDIIRDPGYNGDNSTVECLYNNGKMVPQPIIILDRLNAFLEECGLETVEESDIPYYKCM